MPKASLHFRSAIVASLAGLFAFGIIAVQQPPTSARWITAWATSQHALGVTAVTNATVRMIARVTIPGEAVRIRVDNTFGTAPLVIGKANEGIGGNTITREQLQPPPDSPPGLERLDRDVLTHHGVTHVMLFMGTNDIRREAPAGQVIAGLQDVIRRVKVRGLKVVGATVIPRHNRPPAENNTGWNAAKTRVRNDVNQWIRTKAPFDAVIDFDKVVQDPENSDLIYPPFNCGDGVHPSPRGYYEMGRSVQLDVFK